MNHPVEFFAGFAVVLFVLSDVFAGVLVPRPTPRRFRIAPLLARALPPLWRLGTRPFRSARQRQHVRSSLGPAILVCVLITWVAGLSFGFALMLHSQPQDVSIDRFGFGEALFQSSLAISTLGMIHADITGWARAIVAVAGISGFSVLTLVVAFLLSIQNALDRREALVLTLPARAGRPPTATQLLQSYDGAADADLAGFFAEWERWTADVTHSHLANPALFRFRSLYENGEWLVCLGAVLDAAALVRAAAPANYPRTVRAATFLAGTAERSVAEFATLLRIDRHHPARDGAPTGRLAPVLGATADLDQLVRLLAAHAEPLRRMAELGDIAWSDTLSPAY